MGLSYQYGKRKVASCIITHQDNSNSKMASSAMAPNTAICFCAKLSVMHELCMRLTFEEST